MHRPVCAEHDSTFADTLHPRDKRGRQSVQGVGRGVDVKVLKLYGNGDQLIDPWKADMARDNDKLGKVEQHILEIGNEPPRF